MNDENNGARPGDDDDGPIVPDPVENERDESDILANQDETDSGDVNEDDYAMGAGPTDKLSAAESDEFKRGELDVVEQMNRANRAIEFPNRARNPQREP